MTSCEVVELTLASDRMHDIAIWKSDISQYLSMLVSIGRPPTTVKLRRDQLTYVSRELGAVPALITREIIEKWFGEQTWQLETRRSYRSAVRGFFSYLYECGRIQQDPAEKIAPVAVGQPVPRPTPDYAWTAAIERAKPRVQLMLRLAAEAGLRRGEIAQIDPTEDLDYAPAPLLLVHGKGAKERIIPISDDLAAGIRRQAMESDGRWLFPNGSGGHLAPITVGLLCAEALPDHWTLHTLRHRFATRAYRATRNLRAVQMLLGHASVATTQRYLAIDDDEMRAAMLGAAA